MRQLLEAIVVLLEAEDVDLAFLLVPIAADPLEYSGAVVEGVSHHADLCLGQGHYLPLEVGVRGRHLEGSLRFHSGQAFGKGRLQYRFGRMNGQIVTFGGSLSGVPLNRRGCG